MLSFAILFAFALAAADRARRREASPVFWGLLTGVVCLVAMGLAGLFLQVPAGLVMVILAAKLGKTSKACPSCGKTAPIDVLACPHCGASPRSKFLSGI